MPWKSKTPKSTHLSPRSEGGVADLGLVQGELRLQGHSLRLVSPREEVADLRDRLLGRGVELKKIQLHNA